MLTAVGGTAGRLIPDGGQVGYAAVVTTIDEMVNETRRQIKYGADWIKIHATGSIPNRSGELQVWTLDEMKAVCDTAHALGVPVTAHCRNAASTRDAALAGVDLILHASYVDDEASRRSSTAGRRSARRSPSSPTSPTTATVSAQASACRTSSAARSRPPRR
jgi:imidazolonepropionase-like amidohydrolase